MAHTLWIRDHNGELACCNSGGPDEPLTVTVSPWFAPPSRIPDGHRMRPANPLPMDAEATERVVDHVVAWSGWYATRSDGAVIQLDCTRNNVRTFLTASLHLYRQVEAAINTATAEEVIEHG